MRTYRHNGEAWFKNDHGLLKRLRIWLIWIGGLEKANHTGWTLHSARLTWRACQDLPLWLCVLDCLTPISLLGHRATLQWFGLDVRWRGAYLCIHWRNTKYGPTRLRIYRSPNGTPSSAYLWLHGAPQEVIAAAEQHQRRIAERDAQWAAERAEASKRAQELLYTSTAERSGAVGKI